MDEFTMERYGQALLDQTAQFGETVRHAAVDAPVPTCPGWTATQLVEHVGQTQHWVASIVEQRVSDPSQLPTSFPTAPAGPDAWAAWLADGASRLVAACADAGADAPVWNPAGDARSGPRFWLRRILCETIIHRADAAVTADVAYVLEAELAADAITDHLAMMTSPGWADVTVRAPATALLLALTRRRSGLTGLEVSGDVELFTHWIENTAHQAG